MTDPYAYLDEPRRSNAFATALFITAGLIATAALLFAVTYLAGLGWTEGVKAGWADTCNVEMEE